MSLAKAWIKHGSDSETLGRKMGGDRGEGADVAREGYIWHSCFCTYEAIYGLPCFSSCKPCAHCRFSCLANQSGVPYRRYTFKVVMR